jgi:hypothetical protein
MSEEVKKRLRRAEKLLAEWPNRATTLPMINGSLSIFRVQADEWWYSRTWYDGSGKNAIERLGYTSEKFATILDAYTDWEVREKAGEFSKAK